MSTQFSRRPSTRRGLLAIIVAGLLVAGGAIPAAAATLPEGEAPATSVVASSPAADTAPEPAAPPPVAEPVPEPSVQPEPALTTPPGPAPEPDSQPAPDSEPVPSPQPGLPATPGPAPDTLDAVSRASLSSAPIAVLAAGVVDVTVNVSGPSAAYAGDAFTFTVTMSNNELAAADGAPFAVQMPTGVKNVLATCVASAGATCPPALSISNAAVSGTATALPHLGMLTVTITGNFAIPSATSVTAQATISAPAGSTDTDPSSNASSVSTVINNTVDVRLSQTQSSTTIAVDAPVTYTLTLTNDGPGSANGSYIYNEMGWSTDLYNSLDMHLVSCDVTGGAECPTIPVDARIDRNRSYATGYLQVFPAGSTITVVYTATPVENPNATCSTATTPITNSRSIGAPSGMTDPTPSNNAQSLVTTATGPGVCPAVDLAVTKSQSASTISAGSPITYTVTYSNLGPNDTTSAVLGDSFTFNRAVFSSVQIDIVSCTVVGAVVCPTINAASFASYGYFQSVVSFPAGASITLVYTMNPVDNVDAVCGVTSSTVSNSASVFLSGSGSVDPNAGNNNRTVYASAPGTSACPAVDVQATRTQSSATILPGQPITYTVTYSNAGPTTATNVTLSEYVSWSPAIYANITVSDVSCTASGGVTCPTVKSGVVSPYQNMITDLITSFPAGASFTVVYTIDPNLAVGASCGGNNTVVTGRSSISVPPGQTDTLLSNNVATSSATSPCVDVAVNKSVTPQSVQAGEAVTFIITVSDSSPRPVRSVAFSDPLPPGFIFGSATCVAHTAASQCGTVAYDAGTRTVSSTIPLIAANQEYVTIRITGTAGPIPGTFNNVATAGSTPGVDAFIDSNPASNSSSVSIQVFNTASSIAITKQLTGLPPGGVPIPLTFTGQIACEGQDTQPWSVTIPAGGLSASAPPTLFYDGLSCSITENAPPVLPDGITYIGPPVITPAVIPVLGPAAAEVVVSTTPLSPVAVLQLAKTVDRSPVTSGQTVNYVFQVTNGGLVDLSDVTVHELSFTGTGTAPVPSCPSTTLAAGDSMNCTADYEVTAADQAAGLVTNSANATATAVTGPDPTSETAIARVTVVAPPALTLTKAATPGTLAAAGGEVTYTYSIRNTGGLPLTAVGIIETTFSGHGPTPAPTCDAGAALLAPGAVVTCRATYTVLQGDVDQGSIQNTAIATGTAPDGFDSPASPEATATVTFEPDPSISVVKSIEEGTTPDRLLAGVQLTYNFVVTNTGNLTLDFVTISETEFTGSGGAPTVTCPPEALAPGEQTLCVGVYEVTADDVLRGSIKNTAEATAVTEGGEVVTSEDSDVNLPEPVVPALTLLKEASPAADAAPGDVVTYTFTVTNTGNAELFNVAVREASFTGTGPVPEVTCPNDVLPLLPGAVRVCTATYEVAVADVLLGTVENTASAVGEARFPLVSQVTSEASTATVTLLPAPAMGLSVDKTAAVTDSNGDGITDAGDSIEWILVVTNTGAAPLVDVTVDDPSAGPVTCQVTAIEPGASIRCTVAAHPITAADAGVGAVVNTATASGTDSFGREITSAEATARVAIETAVPPTPTPTPTAGGDANGAGGSGDHGALAVTGSRSEWMVALALLAAGAGAALLAVPRRRTR